MTIALVVGHKETAKGAYNITHNISEFDFNNRLAIDISNKTSEYITIIYRSGYKALPDVINIIDPIFVVSLHCNAFNTKASGSEVLYYHSSTRGKKLATVFQEKIKAVLNLPDRGVKSKSAEDRGGYLLRYTNAPCIICEPFFIDNDSDLETARENYVELVNAYASAIEEGRKLIN
jgi:N-acetylmuramoyl-L-alanine amidase